MRIQGAALLCWALGAEGMPLGHARHLLIYDPSGMHLAIMLMVRGIRPSLCCRVIAGLAVARRTFSSPERCVKPVCARGGLLQPARGVVARFMTTARDPNGRHLWHWLFFAFSSEGPSYP